MLGVTVHKNQFPVTQRDINAAAELSKRIKIDEVDAMHMWLLAKGRVQRLRPG